jgi:hypothetical protein
VPRLYAYPDLPAELTLPVLRWRDTAKIRTALLGSRHATTDGSCADFYLLPTRVKMRQRDLLALITHISRAAPWWNETVADGFARHVLFLPGDHGPGDTAYARQPDNPSSGRRAKLPRSLWPENPSRSLIFVMITGNAQRGCVGCVRPLDIRIPSPHPHVCGPLCGYEVDALLAHSPWSPPNRARSHAMLGARRPFRLFWAGRALHAVRIALLVAQSRVARNKLVDTGGGERLPPELRTGKTAQVDYASAM